MIAFITKWIQGIIVAVIIANIIEMILPEGSSKKYIKVVIGVFILYNIITPVVTKLSGGKIDIAANASSYFQNLEETQVVSKDLETSNQSSIKDIYISNLEKDMKSKLETKGYKVNTLKVDVESKSNEYSISKVSLNVEERKQEDKNKIETSEEKVQVNTIDVNISIDEVKIGKEETVTDNPSNTKLSKEKIKEIKNYLKETYEINENLIIIGS